MAGEEYTPSAAGNSHNLVPGVWQNPVSVIANRVAATACLVFILLPRSVSIVIRRWSIRLDQRQNSDLSCRLVLSIVIIWPKALLLMQSPEGSKPDSENHDDVDPVLFHSQNITSDGTEPPSPGQPWVHGLQNRECDFNDLRSRS